jgi:RNA polymerase primary sigma factor
MTSGARPAKRLAIDSSLATYIEAIAAYPLLTRDEESALAVRIQAGDPTAVERLVCANLRFAVSIAKKYHRDDLSLSDLINEANLGLIRAAERFDGTKGVRFISYAVWWIRQAIFQALAEHSHTVRVPLSRAATVYRIGRQANSLRQELGREPTQKELAAELNITEEVLESCGPIARSYLSLDAPLASNNDSNLLDCLCDDTAPAPDEEILEDGLTDSVNEALNHLRAREANVLRLYFGFDGNEPMTLERIAAQLGVTRERVRQIKEKGLSHLRKSDQAAALSSFFRH